MSTPGLTITLLSDEDAADVLAFERENRAFFAAAIGDRGDGYFSTFSERHRALVEENQQGVSLLYVVRDASGQVVGRVNLGPVGEDGVSDLGYRLAESVQGRGFATHAVRAVLDEARRRGRGVIRAEVTTDNTASRRVLERTGFVREETGEHEIEIGGSSRPAATYRWSSSG